MTKVEEFLSCCCQSEFHEKKGPGEKNKVFSQKALNKGNMSHSNWRARNVRNTELIILAGSYCVLGQISRPKNSRGEALKSQAGGFASLGVRDRVGTDVFVCADL